MKINIDSWHFNVMLYYRYIRFLKLSKYDRSDSWFKWHYATFDHVREGDPFRASDEITYAQYKRYAIEANKLPMDFCTYWRGVLVFPLWHTFAWSCLAFYLSILFYMMDWGAVAMIGGATILFLVGIVVFIALMIVAYEKLCAWRDNKKPEDKPKEPGFFANIKKSINDHNVCSMVEYADTKKEVAE